MNLSEIRPASSNVSHAQQLRTWFRGLPAHLQKELTELHQLKTSYNGFALLYAVLWLGAGWAALEVTNTPVRCALWLLSGASLHALTILMHECNHGNFFRNQKLDRFYGFLFGLPGLVSAEAYRVMHMKHHQHNRTSQDPDEVTNLSGNPRLLRVFFLLWAVIGMFAYIASIPSTALRVATKRERRRILTEYAMIVIAHGAFFALSARAGRLDIWRSLWAYPLVAAAVLGNIRGWAEHGLTRADSAFTSSRTVTSTRLVSFFMCNLNYHREHHLFAGIPWYNLPEAHKIMEFHLRAEESTTEKSYLGFAGKMLVTLLTPEQPTLSVSSRY